MDIQRTFTFLLLQNTHFIDVITLNYCCLAGFPKVYYFEMVLVMFFENELQSNYLNFSLVTAQQNFAQRRVKKRRGRKYIADHVLAGRNIYLFIHIDCTSSIHRDNHLVRLENKRKVSYDVMVTFH